MFGSFSELHHAYLLIGESREAEEALLSYFEEQGFSLKNSPDYFVFKQDTLGVDEARDISIKASRGAFGEKKVFFISPLKFTPEAQNALLKTFEDPNPNTHFFLNVRNERMLLETLLSRMQLRRLPGSEISSQSEALKFLKLSYAERLNFIKKFMDQDEPQAKLSGFLDDLLLILRNNSDAKGVSEVGEMRLNSDDKGASARLILEHIALVV